jgi:repressor LexA
LTQHISVQYYTNKSVPSNSAFRKWSDTMQGLTKRQEKVLDYISHSINQRGFPPTLREIGKHMGIKSTNGVNDHLRALERKGYLKREDMKSRALKPVNIDEKKSSEIMLIPLIGKIIPGNPIFSENNIEDTITIDRLFIGNTKEVFAMLVNGDAMKNAGILDGDYIFVKKQMFAEKGNIVVAMIGDNPTIRFYQPEKDIVNFIPANPHCVPIMIKRQDFQPMQLLGIVIGTYRRI